MTKHRSRFVKRVARKVGMPPGTLLPSEAPVQPSITLRSTIYTDQIYESLQRRTIDEIPTVPDSGVLWVSLDGSHDTPLIEALGKRFGLHALVLEDITTIGQRPKVDDYSDYLFATLHMLEHDAESGVRVNEISLIFGRGWVLSVQEHLSSCFDSLLGRLEKGSKLRKGGADYLAYSLVDAVVDNYFVVLEKLGDEMETYQQQVVENPTPQTLRALNRLRNDLLLCRKSISPLRDAIIMLQRSESTLIESSTDIYLRDLYDHIVQALDSVDIMRELLTGLHDLYLSTVSNRLNAVMKTLTMIATIFIPLTFVSGIWGMNFAVLPLSDHPEGFWVVGGLMLAMGLGMYWWFRKRKWL